MSKKTPKTSEGFASFQPCKSPIQITNEFLEKQKKTDRDHGANDTLHQFGVIANLIAANYSIFSLNDVLGISGSMDCDRAAISYLFREWVDALNKGKRLNIVEGVYDFKSYIFK
jgi:hypothetical protein